VRLTMRSPASALKALTGMVALLMAGLTAQGATIILAPDGNDHSGDGSLARPFLTISQGSAKSRPGDQILLRGAVYYYVDYQWIGNSGTRAAPVAQGSAEGIVGDGVGR